MTLGALKFRLSKMFPGTDPDVLEGFINDVYGEILTELPWSRLQVEAVLQTVAPYETGTVSVTAGSTAITGDGTTWTAAMSGRQFHLVGRDESYTFTRTADTTATLDRPYEGDTAAGASYKIFKSVYALPSNCRLLQDDAFGGMGRLTSQDFTSITYGTPQNWASSMDDASTPPLMQVELYPIPDEVEGIPYTYTAEAGELIASTTILAVWAEGSPIVEGVTAKIKAHRGDYVGATYHKEEFKRALSGMRRAEAHGSGPTRMSLPSHYTSHRRARWSR